MPIQLSERQQATVSAAITIVAAFVILVALGLIFWLIGHFVQEFSNVLLPLAVAATAAFVFRPYYDWLHSRLRRNPALALTALFLSAIVPLVAFGWFLGDVVVSELAGLIDDAPAWWEHTVAQAQTRMPTVVTFLEENPLGQKLKATIEEHSGTIMEGASYLASKVFSASAGVVKGVFALFGWAVLPVYFAFFLIAEPKGFKNLEDLLPFLKPETRQDVVYLIGEFIEIIVAFFRGQLLIALMQAVLYALGFWMVGLKYGFVIGLVLGFLNIIPYLGSIIGLGVAVPLAFFQAGGGTSTMIAVVVVFTVVQMIEGYVLTPKIMGETTGLHPMVIIVAIFFWGSALGGIMGMILAIPLTAFLVVFWRLAKEKYVQELV